MTDLRVAAEREGWRTLVLQPGLWVGGGGPRPPGFHRVHDGRTIVVGDLHSQARGLDSLAGSAEDRCRRLSTSAWGRYVALILGPSGSLEALFRDPSGALDCVFWRAGAVAFAASSTPRWMVRALRLNWSVDWERMADILADPVLLTGDPPLKGVEGLAPGEVRDLEGAGPGLQVWTPAQSARAIRRDPARAGAALRTALDQSVRGLAAGASGLLVEVSGGLDSAIVAASLSAGGPPAPVLWWNCWGPYREADERRYAQAVAERLGVSLRTLERPEPCGEGELGLDHPPALRPSSNRLDAFYDAAQAQACEAEGLNAVLTGKGGDVALFQTPTTAILADLIAARGPLAFAHPAALVLARRLRRSVWAVACRAARVSRRPLQQRASSLASAEVRARRPPPHPWLADVGGLPLGKRIQISGFAHNLILHGLARRTEAAELLHPFLSQPVMEACLAAPTYVLTMGGQDRLLARRAFADRLPDPIRQRRSKGELGAYYARCLGAALDPLRTHLLEGRLAGAGLLDLPRLEAALELESLIVNGGSPDLFLLTTLESWARGWTGEPPPWER